MSRSSATHRRSVHFLQPEGMERQISQTVEREVPIPSGEAVLTGNLSLPADAAGLALFAHGSGSTRLSPRNVFVAKDALKIQS